MARSTSGRGNLRRHALQACMYPSRPVRRFSITVKRSTRLYSWNTMPIWRLLSRKVCPRRCEMSVRRPPKVRQMVPEVGSISRLMQRSIVDLPVPDGPTMAVKPVPSTVRSMWRRTGQPGLYSLARPEIWRELVIGASPQSVARLGGFAFEAAATESLARALGHISHDGPVLLVGDGHEAVRALEALDHLRRESEIEKAAHQAVPKRRLEIVRIGERRGRKARAAIQDPEVLPLDLAAVGHSIEHVGRHRGAVVVARLHAQDRLVVLTGEDDLVVLSRQQPLFRKQGQRCHVPGVGGRGGMGESVPFEIGERVVGAALLHADD